MGWEHSHLHEFRIGGQRYSVPSRDDVFMKAPPCINERKAFLSDLLHRPGAKAVYTYDFGDSWEHSITVEKVSVPEAGVAYPLCTGGERHGPPEDCGGIGGFCNMLEALADPDHEEHEDMREWIGGSFDPAAFSIEAVNHRL